MDNVQPKQGVSTLVKTPPIKYCLYARKSSEADERQARSIDAQIKEMLQISERDKLEVTDIRKEAHSAKASGERPEYNRLLADIKSGLFNAILTWAPDRLSRNAGDLGTLVDLMDQKLLLEIRTYGQSFRNSPNEKFLLMILCSQAKLENDNRGLNVKRGLRAKVEAGLWPGVAPTGYLNDKNSDKKGCIHLDPERAPVIKQMFEKVAYEKWGGRKLYQWLKEINFKTKNNKPLSLSNIYTILESKFYAGVFEYPRGSDNWYTGKHTPIITETVFNLARQQIAIESHVKIADKEFAFTKLLKCGLCGSGITADEKFKKLKDGTISKYVYYGCTRARDLNCKGGYIREEDLITQFLKIIDDIDINELGMRNQLEKEVERYYKFQASVLGIGKQDIKKVKDIDIKNYAKYILREGNVLEKRALLTCMKSKLVVNNKIVRLEK